jgi:hypothetical protein
MRHAIQRPSNSNLGTHARMQMQTYNVRAACPRTPIRIIHTRAQPHRISAINAVETAVTPMKKRHSAYTDSIERGPTYQRYDGVYARQWTCLAQAGHVDKRSEERQYDEEHKVHHAEHDGQHRPGLPTRPSSLRRIVFKTVPHDRPAAPSPRCMPLRMPLNTFILDTQVQRL